MNDLTCLTMTQAPDGAPPFFIVGCGRSGTTLLRSLLSAHSQIAVTPETHFMKWADRVGILDGTVMPNSVWADYTDGWRFESLAVSSSRCCEIAQSMGGLTGRNLFLSMLRAYGDRLEKPRVGEKSPSHVQYLTQLFQWFPDARVIVMRRDPRAFLASRIRTPWIQNELSPPSLREGYLVESRSLMVVRLAKHWKQVYEDVVPHWEDDPRVYTVAYESLVSDPEREVRQVLQLLGEDYEPGMLTARSDKTVELPAASSPQKTLSQWSREHHARTLKPVSTASVDKWRRELPEAEVAVVESICVAGMARSGYRPGTPLSRRLAGRSLAALIEAGGKAEATTRAALHRLRHRTRN